jgi:D-glycero-D-manno-heptose 1,7-bisphosphate phosphatase
MKIAHISDFHLRHNLPGTSAISRRLSRKMPDLIQEAVRRIGDVNPDLVAVTGDLVDYPFYGMQDQDLLSIGLKDLALVRELFSPLTCPVAFLFGNHDHPQSFQETFGDLPTDFDVDGYRILLFMDEEVHNNFPQRIGNQRERFLEVIQDSDTRPQVHLQHYLISPINNQGYPHSYLEAESLQEAIEKDPRIRLVLSGHYHTGVPLFEAGGTCFSTAPAFGEPPHPFRIYECGVDGITQTEFSLRNPDRPGTAQKTVFLDRDGVINPQAAYRTGPEDFSLIPGVGEALSNLKGAGFALVVVSNQTAVGQGYVTAETVGAVNDRMSQLLSAYGVDLDGVYCRYHSPNAVIPQHRTDTPETKPSPTMLQTAATDLNLDLSASFIVGDRKSDLLAGRNAGCSASILVRTGGGSGTEEHLDPGDADFVADDLTGAARWILEGA